MPGTQWDMGSLDKGLGQPPVVCAPLGASTPHSGAPGSLRQAAGGLRLASTWTGGEEVGGHARVAPHCREQAVTQGLSSAILGTSQK